MCVVPSWLTGSADALLQVYYDPQEASYTQLLDCFFEHVDPTTRNRQGGDMGRMANDLAVMKCDARMLLRFDIL